MFAALPLYLLPCSGIRSRGFRTVWWLPDIDPASFFLGRQGGDDSLKTTSIQQQDIKIDHLGCWVLVSGTEQ